MVLFVLVLIVSAHGQVDIFKGMNMLKRIIMAFILIMLILSLGCETQKKGDIPSQPESKELTGVESVDEITEQMNGIDEIEQDLDFSELNSLEEDLANLNW